MLNTFPRSGLCVLRLCILFLLQLSLLCRLSLISRSSWRQFHTATTRWRCPTALDLLPKTFLRHLGVGTGVRFFGSISYTNKHLPSRPRAKRIWRVSVKGQAVAASSSLFVFLVVRFPWGSVFKQQLWIHLLPLKAWGRAQRLAVKNSRRWNGWKGGDLFGNFGQQMMRTGIEGGAMGWTMECGVQRNVKGKCFSSNKIWGH